MFSVKAILRAVAVKRQRAFTPIIQIMGGRKFRWSVCAGCVGATQGREPAVSFAAPILPE